MLYKFKSQAAADVIMLPQHARKLLQALGREPAQRGVIQASALPQAIAALRAAMQQSQEQERERKHEENHEQNADDDDDEDPVPFHTRAQPFLELLQYSLAEGKDVVWGV